MPNPAAHLPHPKYRPDIDGLRAVAILSVVVFHAFPRLMPGGFVGVDIFFIISGFLITLIILGGLDSGRFTFREFYARRIRRIFPALICVLAACFAAGWFLFFPDDYQLLNKHIMGGAGFVSNFLLSGEGTYFNSPNTKALLHLWSLGIEEQYYLLWPVILWLIYKWKRQHVFAITLIILLLSFAWNIFEISRGNLAAAFYYPQTRFWELMLGSLLAIIHSGDAPRMALPEVLQSLIRRHLTASRNAISITGMGIILWAVFSLNEQTDYPGWSALMPTIAALLLIAAGPQAWVNRYLLSLRPMIWIGLISFPLYLWHWPMLSFAWIYLGEQPSRLLRLGLVLSAVPLAWMTYKWVEQPIRFGRTFGNKKVLVLCLSLLFVGAAGFAGYINRGIADRYPAAIAKILDRKRDYKESYRYRTCFLDLTVQNFQDFAKCDDPPGDRPAYLLWGDSHAAHLYPGYYKRYGDRIRLIQRTASGCAPILNMDIPSYPNCRAANDHIFETIRREKPEKIILAAIWGAYEWEKLGNTIDQLKSLGIKNIDLVGPMPGWRRTLPKELFAAYKNSAGHIPERMTSGLNPLPTELDAAMSKLAREKNIHYLSPVKTLCDRNGCLTRIGEDNETLTAWDYGHLTEKGSEYLVSRFPDK